MINYYLITTAMAILSFIVLIFIYEPRKTNYYYMIIMILTVQTNCGYLAIALSESLEEAVLANKICYLGGCFMPPAIFFLMCAICNYNVTTWLRCILYGYSAFVYLMIMASGYSEYYYKEFYLEEYDGVTVLGRTYGPGYVFFYVLLCVYVLLQLAILIYSFIKKKAVSRYSLWTMVFIEVTTVVLFLVVRVIGPKLESPPLIYGVCSWIFLHLHQRSRMYNIEDNIVGSFGKQENYGYIMFNNRLKYLGCNQMAIEVFPAVAQCIVDRKIDAVPGMNEMILREGKEETILEYATDVKNASMALLGIINEILDSTKLESGMMELEEQDYEIGQLLKDVYGMINVRTKEKNLELVFDIDTQMPKAYWGDDKRIKQVLLNLLTNAVKYTDKGKVILQVKCRAQGDEAFLWFSVKDTGIGIKEENINKIYDAFKRFDLQRNRNVEGTGLGMNITKQFLTLMGSELEIKSEYGVGSEFSFEIKQTIMNHIPVGELDHNRLCAETKCGRLSALSMPDARILVVDDNRMNLKVIKSLLKRYQVQVQEAESGIASIAMLEKEKFDLVFLDHMMPEMDGVETFRVINEKKLAPQTPIVMLTANAIEGDRERYLDMGFVDFLSKPIVVEELERVLATYLTRS